MKIHFPIKIIWTGLKRGVVAAEKAEVISTKSNVLKFLAKLESDFPEVYAGIKQGVAEITDTKMSGGDKAVSVAETVLETAPAIIKAIPGIKDALVVAVTQFFADEISDFKGVAVAGITAAILG